MYDIDMDFLQDFFTKNFVILFIAIVMIVHASFSLRKHPKISVYSILIIVCTLLLALSRTFENYGKYIVDPTFTLIFSIIGYTLRPVCIYLFILLTFDKKDSKFLYLTAIPLLVVLVIYLLSFSPSLKQ